MQYYASTVHTVTERERERVTVSNSETWHSLIDLRVVSKALTEATSLS